MNCKCNHAREKLVCFIHTKFIINRISNSNISILIFSSDMINVIFGTIRTVILSCGYLQLVMCIIMFFQWLSLYFLWNLQTTSSVLSFIFSALTQIRFSQPTSTAAPQRFRDWASFLLSWTFNPCWVRPRESLSYCWWTPYLSLIRI